MIKSVMAEGFKGLDFDQPLYPKTLFQGENGAGKSARTMAVMLTLMGYIPGCEKTNQGILATFGKDKLTVGVEINGTKVARKWSTGKKGTVSQTYLVSGRKAKKDDFIAALAQAGNPKVIDLALFLALSDQKKIDYLFDLFPPAGDIAYLDDNITDLSEKINSKQKKVRDSEAFISKTMTNRSQLDLPSGTLAECNGELDVVKNNLSDAWEKLNAAEIALAEEEARAKAEAKAWAEAEEEKARQAEADRELEKIAEEANLETAQQEVKDYEADVDRGAMTDTVGGPKPTTTVFNPEPAPIVESLHKIIKAIEDSDCPVCVNGVAKMIARAELKRYL